MRKKYCFIVICTLVFFVISAASTYCLTGDANNNGTVDIVDALLVAQYYVGLQPQGINTSVMDVNGDGSIDIVDALLIARYYVGLISSFPVDSQTPVPTPEPTQQVTAPPSSGGFEYGADISWLPQMEAQGYTFRDDRGNQRDCVDILIEHGINAISTRTWVNPSNDPANGHCSISETVELARRCKDKGLRIMVCPHYGDTWNSVGTQNPPSAWANMSYTRMRTALANHVTELMTALKNAGVTPEWFKNGNETNGGICKSTGSVSNPGQMVGLLNAGYDAVKAVFPNVKVIIHVGQPQKSEAQTMLDAFVNNGGKWDILGCSSYASKNDQAGVQSAVQSLKNRYGKEVMMVEVGGRWDRAEDTRTVISAWINGMKSMGGTGVFYWEPECYNWNGYDMGAWDPNTKQPTVAMDAFIH
jgi:arabinogalactan endo-1,4-beta-galactosidase